MALNQQCETTRPQRRYSLVQALASLFGRAPRSPKGPDNGRGPPDPSEEFAKLHRSLRRISLANDQNTELLRALGLRTQELHQTMLKLGTPTRSREVTIAETQLLECLDRLDKVLAIPALPGAGAELLASVREMLQAEAGWQPVAAVGAPPEGIHIRITEVLPNPSLGGFRIHQILEQGYLRSDGSRLREAVVVVTGAVSTADITNQDLTEEPHYDTTGLWH